MVGFKRCNKCDKEGHFGRDCPTLARVVVRTPIQTPTQNQQRRGGNRPQVTSSVYRDDKMGQTSPLARPKKGGPGWNFQPVNPL